jgi:hypothetical protein
MRTCPVCRSNQRVLLIENYDKPPWNLYRCSTCNFRYLDSDSETESTMNDYYKYKYKTDDGERAESRLNFLADHVVQYPLSSVIMDIGGMDGVLAAKLKERGFTRVDVCGAGDRFHSLYDIFILSHTLEHVYNISSMMHKIMHHIWDDGRIIIEGPIWDGKLDEIGVYDYHWQHINKFTSLSLIRLFRGYGFEPESSLHIAPYREYFCHRLTMKWIC